MISPPAQALTGTRASQQISRQRFSAMAHMRPLGMSALPPLLKHDRTPVQPKPWQVGIRTRSRPWSGTAQLRRRSLSCWAAMAMVSTWVRASTTCLIMTDHNRYSIDARAAGRMVLVRSFAERIVVLFNEVVADHPRQFRRDQIIYDPWHYLPVLVKKPGALRNGAPFKDWDLPPPLAQVRAKLKQHADGDRQFVKVLGAVLDHGLAAVEAACAEALEAGIASGDVILTVLARQQQPAAPPSITTPDALRLKIEPMADCGRYDSIRKVA